MQAVNLFIWFSQIMQTDAFCMIKWTVEYIDKLFITLHLAGGIAFKTSQISP